MKVLVTGGTGFTGSHTVRVGSGPPGGVQGAADPNFACAVRSFASLFPTRRLGGGALSVYLDGRPVVDVWTGWADRRGTVPWSADTGAMVFSATKGLASTVIHRLVDRSQRFVEAEGRMGWPTGARNRLTIRKSDLSAHADRVRSVRYWSYA